MHRTKKEACFICIDAGTTRFKAALITHEGAILRASDCSYPTDEGLLHEYRTHEYKTSDFFNALSHTLKKICEGVDRQRIKAIGITGHGPTLIPLERDGTPLSTGIGYLDDRVKQYIKKLAEKKSDHITSTMYIPIALFFKEKLPDIYNKTYKFLQVFDYLAYLITGEFTASSSSSGIKPWTEHAIEEADLDIRKFPPIRYMGQALGVAAMESERLFCIPRGVPVYAVGVDFAAALVGTNTLSKGKSCERAGSSGGLNLCWDRPVEDRRLLCYEHFIKGHWNIAGITSTSGKALWWIKKILNLKEFAPLTKKVHPQKILFFPYLKGERTPLWNPYAKGMLFGTSEEHRAEDILFSVYLGIALSLRDSIEIIEEQDCAFHTPIITTGGGAQNDWFVKLKSDVTGKEFAKVQTEDAELLGIAIILATALGFYPDLRSAAGHIVKVSKLFSPSRTDLPFYSELYKIYRSIRGLLGRHF